MKQFNSVKKLLVVACVFAASFAKAQIHPLAFGPFPLGTATTNPNWYANYVGLRFEVVSPAVVAGDKVYTYAGGGTTPWGGTVTAPIVNKPIMMPQAGDSLAGVAITNNMAGHIAFIYRGGGVEFVCKASRAQAAGAIAIVIVNNISGGPVGMGAGSTCPSAGVTIPVFMISKEDGDAIDARYNAGDTAHITITPWGQGLTNDIGMIPGGYALWHNFAIPKNQIAATGNPAEYNMIDGAFVANFGSDTAYNVRLKSTLSFTPTGGSTTVQHVDSVLLNKFSQKDSIWAMFDTLAGNHEYALASTATGRYDITYDVHGTADDEYDADNSLTRSFYTTDSLYSKSRYDFANNHPINTIHESFGGGAEFLWGPMYYVKNGGATVSTIQYSLASNTPGVITSPTDHNIFLFKWDDGSNGQPMDSVMQDGELTMTAFGDKVFDMVNDSSGANLTFSGMSTPDGDVFVRLQSNSWYYLAIDVPASFFLGADGVESPYPRIYGRFMNNFSWLDYSSVVANSSDELTTVGGGANAPSPASSVNFVNSVDSFNFDNQKGLIPAVAMIVNNNPPPVSVKSNIKPTLTANVYPNPAKDVVNVDYSFEETAKTATFTIIDGLGRFVSKQSVSNTKSGTYSISTKELASGHYFLVINANGKMASRNFVVAK